MATVVIGIVIAGMLVLGAFHFRKVLRSGCCGSAGDAPPKAVSVRDRDPRHYPYEKILTVDGMTCRNCAARVQNALNSLDGVYSRVNLGEKQAVVRLKADLPDALLRRAVAGAGYTVTAVRGGPEK